MSDSRIEALERRLQDVEDRLAIYQLLATYGPAVDSLAHETIEAMWAVDGTYQISDSFYGSARAVSDMLDEPRHQGYVNAGCGHVMSLPHLTIEGDTAVATGYARIHLTEGDNIKIQRMSATRWELVRTAAGWQVKRRTNIPLDGRKTARELLARALEPKAKPSA